MPLTDAQAEAGKALAETTGKALDLSKGIGSYLAETIGTIPQDLLGVAGGDWLHEKRQRNLAQMRAKTARILEGVEKERISEPSPSVVMPLLEAAKDEGREELQRLWAALLAQAMIDGGRRVRRAYFEVIQKLEPLDAVMLKALYELPFAPESIAPEQYRANVATMNAAAESVNATAREVAISYQALVAEKCIRHQAGSTIYMLTDFGRALLEVLECNKS